MVECSNGREFGSLQIIRGGGAGTGQVGCRLSVCQHGDGRSRRRDSYRGRMRRTGRFTSERWTESAIPAQTGRTFIVTGANSGIGLESARCLVAADARVILACRNEEKGRAAAADIRSSCERGQVLVRRLDLADLNSVRSFADRIRHDGDVIHCLINNAGVFALDQGRTVDGFETHFGVNHLGHFALTGLLLPSLLGVASSRIVNVSSLGHRAGRIDFDDPMYDHRRYSRWGAYFQSKLVNLLFTRELQRRLATTASTTVVVAAHPGTAHTEIGKLGSSAINRAIRRFMPILVRSGVHGARSPVRAAVDDRVSSGDFLGPRFMFLGAPVLERPARRARVDDDARRLWDLSEELTGVAYPI